MKKVVIPRSWYPYLIAALIVVVVVGGFMLIRHHVPGLKGRKAPVTFQPQGKLTALPKEMIFYFQRSYPGIEGAAISKDSIKNYITISPDLAVQGRWTTDAVFELQCLTPPKPDQKYEVTISRIPVLSGEVRIPPQTFTFTTPGFELLSAYVRSMRRDQAVVGLDFTYAPVMDKIGKYITVTNGAGKDLTVWDIQRSHGRTTQILLTLPALKADDQYKIAIKKGLRCDLGLEIGGELQQTIKAGPTIGPILVRGHRIEESDYGYTIAVQLTSSDEQGLEIKDENLERFVRISPEIPCRVTAAMGTIYIFGDLIPERKYKVTIKAGISSKRGGVLPDDYGFDITVPKSKEKLQFVYRGRYLGRTGEWNLPLKVTGVRKLKLNITYLPSDNVLFWHLNDAGLVTQLTNMGEKVVKDQEIPIEKGTRSNFAWVDLKQYLKGDEHGVFLVEVTGETQSHATLSDRIAVVISDLSLVMKWQKHKIYVWCYNSASLKPESGVEVEVRSAKNFIAGKGTTGGDGFCQLPVQREEREPYIVFARRGDEWTYVHVPTVRLPMEAYDINGEDPAVPYLAFLYPERDLYRPGDAVHFSVIVRNNGDYRGAAIPVKVKVRDPEGKDFVALSGTTDENGYAEFSFPTTPSSPTGKYMLEVVSGDRSIYAASIFVEAFVPERMNVAIGIPDKIRIEEPFDLTVKADFLFGAPAAGERFSGKVKATETEFKAPGYGNYLFGQVRLAGERPGAWEQDLAGGTLDSKGQGKESIEIDTTMTFNGPIRIEGQVSVSEGGSGRVTSRSLAQTVYTKPFYIGIRPAVTRIVPGQPVDVRGVILKPDGSLYVKPTQLSFCAYRLSYHYDYEDEEGEGGEDYDYHNWNVRSEKVPVIPRKPFEAQDGKFNCTFTPQDTYYDYLIEVVNENHQVVAEAVINGWGWWEREQRQQPRVESPEVIPLRLDKEQYDEGDQVKVEALLPFDGDILWTVELDTVYTWEMHAAKGEIASWSFTAPHGVANVYVSGLLVRSGGNYLVQRGLGVQRVKIRPSAHKLALTIDVPEKIKPGEDLTVTVKGNGRYRGTVSVVDEGILQITNFTTPDPYESLLRNLGLTMNGAESFGWIIRKFLDRAGGDMAAKEKEFPQARFARIVSNWSGLKNSDANGTVSYTIHVPEYNGKLRVMVAGASPTAFGAAHADVIVESEVIVTPTIPRFAYTSDECRFPVTLINTTAYQRTVSLTVQLKNGTLAEGLTPELTLGPGEKQIAWVPCRVGTEPGGLGIDITAKSKNERYHDSFQIPVYPNTPYITESEYSELAPHQTVDLKKTFDDWFPRAHRADILLSPVLGLTRLNHARYVVQYPYGCIEQSSTSTLVLLRLSPLWVILSPGVSREKYLDMVNYGIHRIMSMQTVSGGFSYWPGEAEPCEWGSAYATFVLMEAKAAGFTIPEGVIGNALEYLENVYNKSGLMLYVLARGRRLQRNPENVDHLVTLAKQEQYGIQDLLLVAGAIAECGRTTVAKEILSQALKKKDETYRHYSGDFYSYLQYRGMKLFFIEQINPGSPEETALVRELADNLADRYSYYYSTQDLAWTMLSLGIYAERGVTGFAAELSSNNKAIKPEVAKGIWSWRLENPGKADRVKLVNNGEQALYLNIENTGFSRKKTSFEASSKGISVDRTIMDYDGNLASSAKQGDLVVMLITVTGQQSYGRSFENCAIEAQIPAGFEIENPRLGRGDLPAWAKEDRLWDPQYVDIRDDRVVIFGQINSYSSKYYYILARAVTPGKYFLPPVNAVVMYEPQYNAHTDAGTFEIHKR